MPLANFSLKCFLVIRDRIYLVLGALSTHQTFPPIAQIHITSERFIKMHKMFRTTQQQKKIVFNLVSRHKKKTWINIPQNEEHHQERPEKRNYLKTGVFFRLGNALHKVFFFCYCKFDIHETNATVLFWCFYCSPRISVKLKIMFWHFCMEC